MYNPPTRLDYLRRSVKADSHPVRTVPKFAPSHKQRIVQDLKRLGVSHSGLQTMEAHYLPQVIHADEQIGGVVYGMHRDGFAMLIATDRRVIYLDKKPMFTNEEEITYFVVSGVILSHAGPGTTVTLHTKVKDFKIKTLNLHCAEGFVEYIESRSLELKKEEDKRSRQ